MSVGKETLSYIVEYFKLKLIFPYITISMPSKAQWDKMKKFFLLPTKHPGIPGTEEKLFKAYEEAKTNHEKLEIVFHLPIIEVTYSLLLNLCIL